MDEAGGRLAFIERVALGTLVGAAVLGLLALVGSRAEVLLLLFSALLLGIFLRTLAEALSRATSLPVGGAGSGQPEPSRPARTGGLALRADGGRPRLQLLEAAA